MADIKTIAEELVRMSEKEVQELAMVMNNEYNIEPSSPKQYGISLLNKKHKKH